MHLSSPPAVSEVGLASSPAACTAQAQMPPDAWLSRGGHRDRHLRDMRTIHTPMFRCSATTAQYCTTSGCGSPASRCAIVSLLSTGGGIPRVICSSSRYQGGRGRTPKTAATQASSPAPPPRTGLRPRASQMPRMPRPPSFRRDHPSSLLHSPAKLGHEPT